jgi:hypothetical protein
MPGSASSSGLLARASPLRPSNLAIASVATSTAERPAVPEPHSRPISSAAVRPAAPRSWSRSRGRSVAGSSRIRRPRAMASSNGMGPSDTGLPLARGGRVMDDMLP